MTEEKPMWFRQLPVFRFEIKSSNGFSDPKCEMRNPKWKQSLKKEETKMEFKLKNKKAERKNERLRRKMFS